MKSFLEAIELLKAVELSGRFRYYFGLFLIALTTACLDMVSIALVFGIVAVIVNPAAISNIPFLGDALAMIEPFSTNLPAELQIGLMLVVMVILKNLLKIYFSYYQSRLVNDWMCQMTCRIFSTYINAPYLFHKRTNSSELLRNSANLINVSYSGIIKAITTIAASCLVILMIALVLVYLQPIPALVAAVLVAALVVVQNLILSGPLQRLGVEHYALVKVNLRNLMQGYGAIKEVKILGREENLRQIFGAVQERWARLRHIQQFINSLPAHIAELALILAVVALVALSVSLNDDTSGIIPLVALFAAAASRILPAANQVISALHQINTNLPGMRILRREIEHPWGEFRAVDPTRVRALPFHDRIQFSGVSFEYPDSDGPAVHGIDLAITKGEYVGIVGGSGAGKSTLMDLLLGLLEPQAGQISVDGRDISGAHCAWQMNLGYVPQEIFITDDSVRANVAFALPPDQIDEARVWQALTLALLDGFVQGLPEGLDTVLGEHGNRLSGGQRQRIGIARALYREPTVLVFDEPTSDLDIDIEREISNTLLSLKGERTIFVIAHRLTMLNHCDRILVMNEGRIARECGYRELIDNGLMQEDPSGSGPVIANAGGGVWVSRS